MEGQSVIQLNSRSAHESFACSYTEHVIHPDSPPFRPGQMSRQADRYTYFPVCMYTSALATSVIAPSCEWLFQSRQCMPDQVWVEVDVQS